MNTIAIIGGGIGGLCTAIALRRHGIEATVYEAAPQYRPVGAGIGVPANAMQVLDRLGLAERVAASAMQTDRMFIQSENGTVLSAVHLEPVHRRFGQASLTIHRARLHQILREALPPEAVVMNKALDGLEQTEESVRLAFRDGSRVEAGALIAADGLHSRVRHELFPEARLRYSGQTSYRGVARLSLPEHLLHAGHEYWGEDGRFGFAAIGAAEVYWFAVMEAPAGEKDVPGTAKTHIRQLAAPFSYPVFALIEATPEPAITRTDIYDLRPLDRWHAGRVVLLGDAAHATTPNMGQGGAQAIEDAYVLASAISVLGATEAAFRTFQQVRMKKARQVVKTSWAIGKVAHLRNPVARALRNTLMRTMPESANQKQLASLFTLGY